MGVVSDSWFDSVLLSTLYMFQTLMLTHAQTPFLGTPLVPLKIRLENLIELNLLNSSCSSLSSC